MIDQSLSPPTIGVVIGIAEKFSDTVYGNLEKLISEPEAIEPNDETLQNFCTQNDLSETDLRYFLPFLGYLFHKTKNMKAEDILPSLQSFIKDNSDEELDFDRVAQWLFKLLDHRDVQEAALKQQRLSKGFLPYLIRAENFVDVRHNFNRDQDDVLNDNLGKPTTVVQLKLETNSPRAYERYAIFQLDEKAIKKLRQTLDEIEHKLKIINKAEGI